MKIDFTVQNDGNIFLLRPHTQAANVWISEHIPEDVMQFGNAIVVEHSYIADIAAHIQQEGLSVQ